MAESVHQKIETRAYQLFLERSGQHGYHIEDWLQAERETGASSRPRKPGNVKARAMPARARAAR